MDQKIREIFSENSTSYYYSSLFFPSDVKKDVFQLYAYVRTADDFVDEPPQDEEALRELREKTFENWEQGESGNKIIDAFLETARKNDFRRDWVEAFLDSMERDFYKSEYETLDETLEYIYGSAEVIGLMMTKILDIDEESHHAAKMLGRSMQYCNFIRDIQEDNRLNRQYLPTEELEKYGLEGLERADIEQEKFEEFLRDQIEKYREWQKEAEEGFSYLPYRVRVPVILSSRIYQWTADKIEEDPMIVYSEQVRPSKLRILTELVHTLRGRK